MQKKDLFLTCSKQRTMFGSTSCNLPSRFLKEIPQDLLDGFDEALGEKKNKRDFFEDSIYSWGYGKKFNNEITSYNNNSSINKRSNNNTISFGRTAESFLSGLNKKSSSDVDLSIYKEGVKVFHKKFGEGLITKTETEGDDLKVDINFTKVGHKRLMAKFAKLEVLD